MPEDIVELIDDLSAAALDCKWRPINRSEYEDTLAIAHAIVTAFLADGSPRNSPFERLPLSLLRKIFEMAIAVRGDSARRALEDVCRFFRSIVFTSDELWDDVTTFPTDPVNFARTLASLRSSGRPLRVIVDPITEDRRAWHELPPPCLVACTLCDASSIIFRNYEFPILCSMRSLLRYLMTVNTFPNLVKLIVSARASKIGPYDVGTSWFRSRPYRLVSISAPRLRVARLENICIHLIDANDLTELEVNARVSRLRRLDKPLRYQFSGRWPKDVVHDVLVRNTQLTKLHLFDAVRMNGAEGPSSGIIHLPALKELVIASTHTTPAAWIFKKLKIPEFTHISLYLGYNGRLPLDYDELFEAMEPHLLARDFTTLVGYSAVEVSGVLLGSDVRASSRRQFPHDRDSWLEAAEVGHRNFYGLPGAVDIYVVWSSDEIKAISWDKLFAEMAPHVRADRIYSLELCAEYEELNGLLAANGLPLDAITELRLWHDSDLSLSSLLVIALLGDDDRESPRIRDVAEVLISTYPGVTRIVDMEYDIVWEESSSTLALVELIAAGTFVAWP